MVQEAPTDEAFALELEDDGAQVQPTASTDFVSNDGDAEPVPITGGASFDSDRDVFVFSAALGTCSGTLLRNNIVLTARHCLTATGQVGGGEPVLDPGNFFVIQDGPGDSYQAITPVVSVIGASTGNDWGLLQTQSNLGIDGRLEGASTELYPMDSADFVGNVLLCMGYGAEECELDSEGKHVGPGEPVNHLRAGLAWVEDDAPRIELITYPYSDPGDWLPTKGDSGAGCRYPLFTPPNFQRVAGIVSEGTACSWFEGDPQDWKVYLEPIDNNLQAIKGTINNLSDDLLDIFTGSSSGDYEVVEPATMTDGPSQWLHVSGSWLLQNSLAKGPANHAEGTKYIRSDEVFANGDVRVDTFSAYGGAAGIIFRMRDDTHYYRLSFDEAAQSVAIHRRNGTSWQELGSATISFDWWGWHELEIHTWENDFTVRLDGSVVLETSDPAYTFMAGRVGLYTYDHSSYFDNLVIER